MIWTFLPFIVNHIFWLYIQDSEFSSSYNNMIFKYLDRFFMKLFNTIIFLQRNKERKREKEREKKAKDEKENIQVWVVCFWNWFDIFSSWTWEFIRFGFIFGSAIYMWAMFFGKSWCTSCYKTSNKYCLVFCWLLFSVHSSEATVMQNTHLTNVACSWGSKPGITALCGLSLLLALSFPQRGFFLQEFWFSLPQNPTFPNSNLILIARTHLNKFLRSPKCFVGKQITVFFFLNGLLHPVTAAPSPDVLLMLWSALFQEKNNKKENTQVNNKASAKDVDKKKNMSTATNKTVNNNTKLSSGLKEHCVNSSNLQQSGKTEQNSSRR